MPSLVEFLKMAISADEKYLPLQGLLATHIKASPTISRRIGNIAERTTGISDLFSGGLSFWKADFIAQQARLYAQVFEEIAERGIPLAQDTKDRIIDLKNVTTQTALYALLDPEHLIFDTQNLLTEHAMKVLQITGAEPDIDQKKLQQLTAQYQNRPLALRVLATEALTKALTFDIQASALNHPAFLATREKLMGSTDPEKFPHLERTFNQSISEQASDAKSSFKRSIKQIDTLLTTIQEQDSLWSPLPQAIIQYCELMKKGLPGLAANPPNFIPGMLKNTKMLLATPKMDDEIIPHLQQISSHLQLMQRKLVFEPIAQAETKQAQTPTPTPKAGPRPPPGPPPRTSSFFQTGVAAGAGVNPLTDPTHVGLSDPPVETAGTEIPPAATGIDTGQPAQSPVTPGAPG